MGINIYAGTEGIERVSEAQAWLSAEKGKLRYLRESYHGEPYATYHLVAEALASDTASAFIPAATLRERLPETLRLAEERERKVYGQTDMKEIEPVLQSYRDFVELCERVEKETGSPVEIIASY